MGYFLLGLLAFVGIFLMFVILLQRGRGGGLAGAFGGLGGQSAFGTKAGDVFTVITIVTVVIWVLLACVTGWRLRVENGMYYAGHEDKPAVEAGTGQEAEDGKGVSEKPFDSKKSAGSKGEKKAKSGDEAGGGESLELPDDGGDAKEDDKKAGTGKAQQKPAEDDAPGKSPSDGN